MPPAASSRKKTSLACHTCKLRKKKCTEVFNSRGVCERCEQAGLPCSADSPDSALAALGGQVPTTTTTTKRAIAPKHAPPIRPRTSEPTSKRPLAAQPTPRPFAVAPRPTPPPSYPPSSLPLPPPLPATVNSYSASPLSSFTQHNPPLNPFLPQNLHLPMIPLSTHGGATAVPETLFDLPNNDELLAFFESLNPAIELNGFDQLEWNNPAPSAPLPSAPQAQPPARPLSSSSAAASPNLTTGTTPTDWRTLQSPADGIKTPRQEDSEASIPIYEALSDSWLSSMPKPIREMIRNVITNTAFSSTLSESACLALCLLYRARMLDASAGAEARERLIKQSDAYFQDAVAHLDSTSIPLEAQLLGIMDLSVYQLEHTGPVAAWAVFSLGDHFVNQSLGPNYVLDLEVGDTPLDIMLQGFALNDILRCIVHPHRRTLFRYLDDPVDPPPLPSSSMSSRNPNNFLPCVSGLPMRMVACVSATANLAYDEVSLTKEEVKRRAGLIERALKGWRAPPLTAEDAMEDAVAAMDALVTSEMWRQACLIFLYQTVLHLGPLAPCVRHALTQLIALGSRTTPPLLPPQPAPSGAIPKILQPAGERVCTWLIASTACILDEERDMCREGFRRAMSEQTGQKNLVAIERLWEITKETGRPVVDWREALQREGLSVMFY